MSEVVVEEVRRWPSMRFCDAPSLSAVTRYDLNANGIGYASKLLHGGFGLGMPSLSGEPGGRGRVWSERVLSLPLEVEGSKPSVLARLERVAREMMREENWLEWQLDADSAPRWFRTYATAPAALSLARVQNDRERDAWGSTLSVAADPFAVGELITLGPFTIANHPTSGTNRMRVAIDPVVGEAATPATVLISKAAAGAMLGPAVAVTDVQAASFTAASWGAAVAAAVTDASYVAGSYRPTTGALADWTPVAAFNPTGLPFGRYRALLRLAGSSDAGSLALRWKVSAGVASQVYSTPVVVPVRQQQRWVTSGEVPYPLIDGGPLATSAATTLTLEAKRVQAGGELRLDNVLTLLSADPGTSLLRAQPDPVAGAFSAVLVDAESRTLAAAVAGAPARAPGAVGGWPLLSPTETNHLWIAQSLDPTAVSGTHDVPGSSTSVTITYRPRYLWGV